MAEKQKKDLRKKEKEKKNGRKKNNNVDGEEELGNGNKTGGNRSIERQRHLTRPLHDNEKVSVVQNRKGYYYWQLMADKLSFSNVNANHWESSSTLTTH